MMKRFELTGRWWMVVHPLACLACMILAGSLLASCAAPFSDLQSARVTDEGEVEITGYYSGLYFDDEGLISGESMEEMQDHFGLQMETGFGTRKSLRLRVERITFSGDIDDPDAFTVFAAGPKFGQRAERFALYFPVGFATGSGLNSSKTWQVHPTLIVGFPVSGSLEINGSGKILLPLNCKDCDETVAVNIGLAFAAGPLMIRPETGIMVNPGEDGHIKQFSLGVSYRSGTR
jgi:hypothetical protein